MLLIYLSALETPEQKRKMKTLYEQHKRLLFHIALKRLNGNAHMAEDAVHNTFMALMERKEKYFSLSEGDLLNLCVSIVRNKSIDTIRRGKNIDDTPVDEYYDLPAENEQIDDLLIRHEEYVCLKRCLAQLDEDRRAVLELKYFQRLSYAEIAEELGITEKQVGKKLQRARLALKKLMEKEETAP